MKYSDANAEDTVMLMIKNSTCRKNWMATGTGEKKCIQQYSLQALYFGMNKNVCCKIEAKQLQSRIRTVMFQSNAGQMQATNRALKEAKYNTCQKTFVAVLNELNMSYARKG